MSECHKCPESMNPANRRKAFVDTPCAACRLSDEPNHRGQTHMSLNANEGDSRNPNGSVVENEVIQQALDIADRPYFGDDMFSREDLEVGLRELLALLTENPISARIVLFRISYPHRPLREIAGRVKISVQAAHSRLQKAVKAWPELAAIIPMSNYKVRK